MAVKVASLPGAEKLVLEIDNGELAKLNTVLENWKFKDYQAFMRFAVSIFLLSQDQAITVLHEGMEKKYTPAKDLVEAGRDSK